MDISDDVAKAKKIEGEAAADLSSARAAVVGELSGIEKIWQASKPVAIALVLIGLFIGFAIGRFSAHV
jgi:hypothetical protein